MQQVAKFSKNLVLHLAETILKNDQTDAPIYIHDLESRADRLITSLQVSEELALNIGGFIDRLDMIEVDGKQVHRVLDYKTGRTDLKSKFFKRQPITDDEYVAAHFTDPKYKSGFQLLFYILVLKLKHPDWQLNGGIVGVRRLNTGIDYLLNSPVSISSNIIDQFKTALRDLIGEIANPEIPFSQTQEVKRCEYCQFRRICQR